MLLQVQIQIRGIGVSEKIYIFFFLKGLLNQAGIGVKVAIIERRGIELAKIQHSTFKFQQLSTHEEHGKKYPMKCLFIG
jgi:hypothetical protein